MAALIELTGQRLGRWTVLGRAYPEGRDQTRTYWLCQCDCGRQKAVLSKLLRNGDSTSCGCYRAEATVARQTKPLATYNSAHTRVAKARGKAKFWPCVDCGAAAAHWAYDHSDPDELVQETYVNGVLMGRVAYSVKPEHYSPKCEQHNEADKRVKP